MYLGHTSQQCYRSAKKKKSILAYIKTQVYSKEHTTGLITFRPMQLTWLEWKWMEPPMGPHTCREILGYLIHTITSFSLLKHLSGRYWHPNLPISFVTVLFSVVFLLFKRNCMFLVTQVLKVLMTEWKFNGRVWLRTHQTIIVLLSDCGCWAGSTLRVSSCRRIYWSHNGL